MFNIREADILEGVLKEKLAVKKYHLFLELDLSRNPFCAHLLAGATSERGSWTHLWSLLSIWGHYGGFFLWHGSCQQKGAKHYWNGFVYSLHQTVLLFWHKRMWCKPTWDVAHLRVCNLYFQKTNVILNLTLAHR